MEDGTVKVWGYNLGGAPSDYNNNGYDIATTPQEIPGLTNVVDIVTADAFSFAILEDGTVKGWGENDEYQLGYDFGISKVETPVIIPALDDVKSIYVNKYSGVSMAIKNNGEALVWPYEKIDYSSENIVEKLPITNVKNGLVASYETSYEMTSIMMIIDNNNQLYVQGDNKSDYEICPNNIHPDGTMNKNITLIEDYFLKYYGEERTLSIAKLDLAEKHSHFQPLIDCYKNSNSVDDLENCSINYDPNNDIIYILDEYDINGNYIETPYYTMKEAIIRIIWDGGNKYATNMFKKLNLTNEHMTIFEPIMQCLEELDVEAGESVDDCFDENPLYGFYDILNRYYSNGEFIEVSNDNMLACYDESIGDGSDTIYYSEGFVDNCLRKIKLSEKHVRYQPIFDVLDSIDTISEIEENYYELGIPREIVGDFLYENLIDFLSSYDRNGNYIENNIEKVYFCPEYFSTLTKLPYINNVSVLNEGVNNKGYYGQLKVGIIDGQIFVWGKLSHLI